MHRFIPPRIALKPLVVAAALAAIGTSASAQSNVTLFGIVDAGVRYVENGDRSITSGSSNGIETSRLGFRGTEDLGGGLQAGFWLEAGLTPDTGGTSDAARLFNRRSTVSLFAPFGEVRLGRDRVPTYTGWLDFDVFGDNGVGAGGKFSSTLGTTVDTNSRADNLAQYFLPGGLGGFYGSIGVAAGEGTSGKKYYGGRGGWAAGALDVSIAYGETFVTENAFGDDKYTIAEIGASYDFGFFKLSGYYDEQKFGGLKLAVANVGASLPLGPGRLRASYINANSSGSTAAGVDTGANDAEQFAIGYVYDLSKRTALYGTVARVNNKGAATFAVAAAPAFTAGGQDSTGYEFGIRHRF